MPNLTQLAVLFAAAFVLAIAPGPGIFYVAARNLAGGRPEGMASTAGTGLGGMVHVVAGALAYQPSCWRQRASGKARRRGRG